MQEHLPAIKIRHRVPQTGDAVGYFEIRGVADPDQALTVLNIDLGNDSTRSLSLLGDTALDQSLTVSSTPVFRGMTVRRSSQDCGTIQANPDLLSREMSVLPVDNLAIRSSGGLRITNTTVADVSNTILRSGTLLALDNEGSSTVLDVGVSIQAGENMKSFLEFGTDNIYQKGCTLEYSGAARRLCFFERTTEVMRMTYGGLYPIGNKFLGLTSYPWTSIASNLTETHWSAIGSSDKVMIQKSDYSQTLLQGWTGTFVDADSGIVQVVGGVIVDRQ